MGENNTNYSSGNYTRRKQWFPKLCDPKLLQKNATKFCMNYNNLHEFNINLTHRYFEFTLLLRKIPENLI